MDEKKITAAPETEVQNEELQTVAGGFPGLDDVPTVPVNPIDDELREDA